MRVIADPWHAHPKKLTLLCRSCIIELISVTLRSDRGCLWADRNNKDHPVPCIAGIAGANGRSAALAAVTYRASRLRSRRWRSTRNVPRASAPGPRICLAMSLLFLLVSTPVLPAPITYTLDAGIDFVSGESGDLTGNFTFDLSGPTASDAALAFTGDGTFTRYNGLYGFMVIAANNKRMVMKDFLATHMRSLELEFMAPLSDAPDSLIGVTLAGAGLFEEASDGGIVGEAVPTVVPPSVPEPSSATLLLTGVLGLLGRGVLLRSRGSRQREARS